MSRDTVAFGLEHITTGIGRSSTHVFEEGKGSYITTEEGVRLLDFSSGIGVVNLGHCHPAVTKAAQEQCAKITHAQVNIGLSATQIALLRDLLTVMPFKELDTFFLTNSGAEAVEGAVKIARTSTKRQNIIVVQGSYHGRTACAAAMTRSKTIYSMGTGPQMPGVFTTPFPYYSQLMLPADTPEQEMVDYSLARLRMLLKQETAPSDTAAIFIESVIGEGGYVPAPAAFLQGVREICDEHGILLVADEVQSGYGRTGTMFAIEKTGVCPDMMLMAKGIANGFPLSAVVGKKACMNKMPAGTLGGTYSGNAVACAAARAVIKAFRDENVLANVEARGQQLLQGIEKMRAKPYGKLIEDVRGSGLMIGIQFQSPTDRPVNAQLAAACMKRNMILLTTSIFDVVRTIPPLTISESEMDDALRILDESLAEVAAALGV